MRHRLIFARALSGAVTLGCVMAAFAGAAGAKTIKMPESDPQVMFDIPDGWTVTSSPLGVELAPPDKSALLIAGLVKRDRAVLTKWQKDATEQMTHFGVAFDPKAKKSAGGSPAPATTLFSGAPTIGTPEQGPTAATAYDDKDRAGLPLEDLTGRAPPKGAKIPVSALVLYGASYLGTPVDAEFLNFALSPKELFLMQQESGKTDERIGTIVDTVRRPEK